MTGALVLLAASALAAGAVKLTGKVTKAPDATGIFELRASGGTYNVTLGTAPIECHKATPLGQCADHATIAVLGKKQKPTRDPQSGSTSAPALIQISAVVVGAGFERPPVPPDLAARGLEWVTGRLGKPNPRKLFLNELELQLGPDRKAIEITKGDHEALAKGATVFVYGEAEEKSKDVAAKKVTIISPEIPAAEYKLAFGP